MSRRYGGCVHGRVAGLSLLASLLLTNVNIRASMPTSDIRHPMTALAPPETSATSGADECHPITNNSVPRAQCLLAVEESVHVCAVACLLTYLRDTSANDCHDASPMIDAAVMWPMREPPRSYLRPP